MAYAVNMHARAGADMTIETACYLILYGLNKELKHHRYISLYIKVYLSGSFSFSHASTVTSRRIYNHGKSIHSTRQNVIAISHPFSCISLCRTSFRLPAEVKIAMRVKMTSLSPHILMLFSASVMIVLLGKTVLCANRTFWETRVVQQVCQCS